MHALGKILYAKRKSTSSLLVWTYLTRLVITLRNWFEFKRLSRLEFRRFNPDVNSMEMNAREPFKFMFSQYSLPFDWVKAVGSMAPVPESKREHEKEQVMLTVTKTVLQAELAAKRWVNCRPTWSAKRGRRCRRTWTRWPTKWPIRRRGCYCSCTKTIRPFTVGSKTPPAPPTTSARPNWWRPAWPTGRRSTSTCCSPASAASCTATRRCGCSEIPISSDFTFFSETLPKLFANQVAHSCSWVSSIFLWLQVSHFIWSPRWLRCSYTLKERDRFKSLKFPVIFKKRSTETNGATFPWLPLTNPFSTVNHVKVAGVRSAVSSPNFSKNGDDSNRVAFL